MLFVVALVGCAQNPSVETPGASGTREEDHHEETPSDCSRVGAEPFELEAEDLKFGADCLQVPAGSFFKVELKNRDDGIPHNFAIYASEHSNSEEKSGSSPSYRIRLTSTGGGGEAVFRGDQITGPGEVTYDVGGLSAGSYRFQCDVHPDTMSGKVLATS